VWLTNPHGQLEQRSDHEWCFRLEWSFWLERSFRRERARDGDERRVRNLRCSRQPRLWDDGGRLDEWDGRFRELVGRHCLDRLGRELGGSGLGRELRIE
jgi:hypothetical protein